MGSFGVWLNRGRLIGGFSPMFFSFTFQCSPRKERTFSHRIGNLARLVCDPLLVKHTGTTGFNLRCPGQTTGFTFLVRAFHREFYFNTFFGDFRHFHFGVPTKAPFSTKTHRFRAKSSHKGAYFGSPFFSQLVQPKPQGLPLFGLCRGTTPFSHIQQHFPRGSQHDSPATLRRKAELFLGRPKVAVLYIWVSGPTIPRA